MGDVDDVWVALQQLEYGLLSERPKPIGPKEIINLPDELEVGLIVNTPRRTVFSSVTLYRFIFSRFSTVVFSKSSDRRM